MDQTLSDSLKTQPIVTVVIPTFNEADNLAKITAALFALGLPDLRILIVDDNSPDGTAQLVEEYAQSHPNGLRVLRTTQSGLTTAIQAGIDAASGGYSMPPIAPDTFSELVQGLSYDPARQQELQNFHQKQTAKHYGLKEDLDPKQLGQAGWGIVFPTEVDPAIVEALQPLIDWRKRKGYPVYVATTAETGTHAHCGVGEILIQPAGKGGEIDNALRLFIDEDFDRSGVLVEESGIIVPLTVVGQTGIVSGNWRVRGSVEDAGATGAVAADENREAVALKDGTKARRDDRADAELRQCPDGMLTTRPTAKILTAEQCLRARIRRLVEHKLRIDLATTDLRIPPARKQTIGEPGLRDGLHFTRRDDRVGVDIGANQRRGNCG